MRVRAALADAAPEQLDVLRAEVERHAKWLLSIGDGNHLYVRPEGEELARVAIPPFFHVSAYPQLIGGACPNVADRFNNECHW